jgi:hypothetical protein
MAGSLELVKKTTSSSNADIVTITDCFTADYDVYVVKYVFEDDSGVANNTFFRFLDSSNAAINSTFTYQYASRNHNSSTEFDVYNSGQNEIFTSYLPDKDLSLGKERQGVAYVYNPYSSTKYTGVFFQTHGLSTSNEFMASQGIGLLATAGVNKGFQVIHSGGGNGIKSGATIEVYGVKE